ncbi:TPA: hypothetical protein DHW58_02190 [Patescibacteria group bacterium]|uniref:Uncharacterized protein n=2 Tax=Bacteria division Kazan-3B-28 TaxID=1798534 RepID=A0A0G1X6I9_UNCK3|nr:MAG: hypothetical protein VE98_C0001G0258 [candidate division Kazan bacterium GW2011_GWA1_50_15]KKW25467.1 MAG: hypothetical protein VE99_C0001G0104 [candidate division Kazan bacterium GW2011_GWC1_52_13]KKW26773.1 MAG: hypothetical protein VF00_C0002G0098 [candidate division Kazan bacterium GW2011_GWB1_52_7]HAV65768.1 hypothetical protein [Patescibacteria group bacterium]HCL47778.1 hypothetical protein [Patescibacteria group bacterium]
MRNYLIGVLGVGVIFAAFNVGREVGLGINPFTTTCIYGGLAFLIALLVAAGVMQKRLGSYLNWWLAAGALFAWANWILFTWSYYQNRVCPLNCPNATPWTATCLYGALLFTAALFLGLSLKRVRK